MGGRTSSGSRWTESRESRSPSNRRGIVSVAAPLAQWIEHLPSKQRVGGSNPSRGAIFVSSVRFCAQIHVVRALGSRGRRNTSEIGRRCMLPPGREIRRRFWLQIRGGMVRDEAALSVGLDGATGHVWFRQAGGVTPPHLLHPRGRRYLSIAEREDILAGVER